ncbi:uncharacterized protein Z519_10797 [Cladophialophora bantiana CBS 173.52]|uniref:Uncharacterized protein n=1 Tax=Cladophialophora bantiana (strain ATCC 10958 / CBS 173.52 / CDC B-1940 / NIH 8579) TaxID=1442370 RepID=A0A0D2HCX9_CLAB1|nr:uncharacterized protein Z519_10797 [Cladophialophora bantiana CBS 173.52]KIW88750.1 hypothetical protein Z519_10797 [Cladophialophora bantiana CBS 173.52]
MEPPPPPPPPHGTNPQGGGRSGGLPDGRYDIFVIPPHSSGSGFLYLPSLQTHRNSFLAGVFCTAASFFIYYTAVPVVKEWLLSTINSGGTGVFTLICGVAVVAWAFGKTQSEWQSYSGFNRGGTDTGSGGPGHGGYGNTGSYTQPGPQSHTQPPPPPPPPNPGATGPPPPPPNHGTSSPPPQSSWQRPPPQANTKANTTSAKSSWEKAREETRKREEERKRAEELKRRREELEKERQRQKEELEKERQKQEELEKERQRQKEELEKELQRQKEELERERQRQKEHLERERLKLREKELLERLERERKEKKEREEKEAAAKAAAAAEAAAAAAEKEKQEQAARSPPKRPPMPTATTERDDDAYSFRPYDRPKRTHKANSAASMYSESSYAPSESTAKTTPPPSVRGPYSTKDPDKIIIKGVFSFNNAFMRTPISQLVSGQGNVTDGLILRITTEGLFIDDDVRGVPQREWDVKAWTMKLAEVWCPSLSCFKNMDSCTPTREFYPGFGLNADSRREPPSPSEKESTAFVNKLLDTCRGSCELSGLHVLRASIRDQEGKKYVFILSQSEGWKVAVGLQRLRRGTQVRALGVAGLPMNEAKAILENLGFA